MGLHVIEFGNRVCAPCVLRERSDARAGDQGDQGVNHRQDANHDEPSASLGLRAKTERFLCRKTKSRMIAICSHRAKREKKSTTPKSNFECPSE